MERKVHGQLKSSSLKEAVWPSDKTDISARTAGKATSLPRVLRSGLFLLQYSSYHLIWLVALSSQWGHTGPMEMFNPVLDRSSY